MRLQERLTTCDRKENQFVKLFLIFSSLLRSIKTPSLPEFEDCTLYIAMQEET